jgi:catalase
MTRLIVVGLITFVTGALTLAAVAQEKPKQPASTGQASYVPELADLMSITQERFSRLAYAPEKNDWDLAAYEAAHLRKTFDTAVKLYPVFGDVQQEKLVHEATTPALNAIDKAISSKDLRRFDTAFKDLRDACNSCHVQARVGFIEIGSPMKARTGPSPRP